MARAPFRCARLDDGRITVAAIGLPGAAISYVMLQSAAASVTFVVLYIAAAAITLIAAARSGQICNFGWANRITWIRATLALIIAGTLADARPLDNLEWWSLTGLAAVAFVLDGIDGFVARRAGQESRFGALFDQEIDAATILILCLLLSISGKIDAWIILVGAMRYAFLIAGYVWPVLARDLPHSRFRSVVCAFQVAALLICLAPLVSAPLAAMIGGTAFCVLAISFGRDVLWLLRQTRTKLPQ